MCGKDNIHMLLLSSSTPELAAMRHRGRRTYIHITATNDKSDSKISKNIAVGARASCVAPSHHLIISNRYSICMLSSWFIFTVNFCLLICGLSFSG
jgi:hypothetical protein